METTASFGYWIRWQRKALDLTQQVLAAVDLGSGEPLTVGYVDEDDPQAVRRWLEPFVQRHGITVIVTDDLASYKIVAEKLQLAHQVCQFHVRRWVGKALRELQATVPKEWLWVLEEIHSLIDLLPPDGSKALYALWKQSPGRRSKRNQARSAMEQLRDLVLRLSQAWPNYCTFQSESIRTGDPLDQQCHRACHWKHENARSHGAWL